MTKNKEEFKEKSVDDYQDPPINFIDSEGGSIDITEYTQDNYDALLDMYLDFDPSERAQGIPPVSEDGVRKWLDNITTGENLIALHESDIVGHAILVPDREDVYELAIFVHQDYQGRGIGTELIKSLLAYAKKKGIEYIWLTVERWNEPALNLYRRVGFESIGSMDFEKEMGLKIDTD